MLHSEYCTWKRERSVENKSLKRERSVENKSLSCMKLTVSHHGLVKQIIKHEKLGKYFSYCTPQPAITSTYCFPEFDLFEKITYTISS